MDEAQLDTSPRKQEIEPVVAENDQPEKQQELEAAEGQTQHAGEEDKVDMDKKEGSKLKSKYSEAWEILDVIESVGKMEDINPKLFIVIQEIIKTQSSEEVVQNLDFHLELVEYFQTPHYKNMYNAKTIHKNMMKRVIVYPIATLFKHMDEVTVTLQHLQMVDKILACSHAHFTATRKLELVQAFQLVEHKIGQIVSEEESRALDQVKIELTRGEVAGLEMISQYLNEDPVKLGEVVNNFPKNPQTKPTVYGKHGQGQSKGAQRKRNKKLREQNGGELPVQDQIVSQINGLEIDMNISPESRKYLALSASEQVKYGLLPDINGRDSLNRYFKLSTTRSHKNHLYISALSNLLTVFAHHPALVDTFFPNPNQESGYDFMVFLTVQIDHFQDFILNNDDHSNIDIPTLFNVFTMAVPYLTSRKTLNTHIDRLYLIQEKYQSKVDGESEDKEAAKQIVELAQEVTQALHQKLQDVLEASLCSREMRAIDYEDQFKEHKQAVEEEKMVIKDEKVEKQAGNHPHAKNPNYAQLKKLKKLLYKMKKKYQYLRQNITKHQKKKQGSLYKAINEETHQNLRDYNKVLLFQALDHIFGSKLSLADSQDWFSLLKGTKSTGLIGKIEFETLAPKVERFSDKQSFLKAKKKIKVQEKFTHKTEMTQGERQVVHQEPDQDGGGEWIEASKNARRKQKKRQKHVPGPITYSEQELARMPKSLRDYQSKLQGYYSSSKKGKELSLDLLTLDIEAVFEQSQVSDTKLKAKTQVMERLTKACAGSKELKALGLNSFEIEEFGSCANGFWTENSDIDLAINYHDTPVIDKTKVLEALVPAVKGIGKNVWWILDTRTPVIKYEDALTGESVDLVCNSIMGCINSQLIKTYSLVSPTFNKLGHYIKNMSKHLKICGATGGYLSSYAFQLLLIVYLQSLDVPVLPNLVLGLGNDIIEYAYVHVEPKEEQGKSKEKKIVYKTAIADVSFEKDVEKAKEGFEKELDKIRKDREGNEELKEFEKQVAEPSLGELAYGFFYYYANKFDSWHMIDAREGRMVKKEVGDGYAYSIIDPFEQFHNPGQTVKVKSQAHLATKNQMRHYIHSATMGTPILLMADQVQQQDNTEVKIAPQPKGEFVEKVKIHTDQYFKY